MIKFSRILEPIIFAGLIYSGVSFIGGNVSQNRNLEEKTFSLFEQCEENGGKINSYVFNNPNYGGTGRRNYMADILDCNLNGKTIRKITREQYLCKDKKNTVWNRVPIYENINSREFELNNNGNETDSNLGFSTDKYFKKYCK